MAGTIHRKTKVMDRCASPFRSTIASVAETIEWRLIELRNRFMLHGLAVAEDGSVTR
jgi:hypothetical protein